MPTHAAHPGEPDEIDRLEHELLDIARQLGITDIDPADDPDDDDPDDEDPDDEDIDDRDDFDDERADTSADTQADAHADADEAVPPAHVTLDDIYTALATTDPQTLADRYRWPLATLLEVINRADFASLAAAHNTALRTAAVIRATSALPAAVGALHTVCADPAAPPRERRMAATAILRLLTTRPPRPPTTAPRPDPPPPHPPEDAPRGDDHLPRRRQVRLTARQFAGELRGGRGQR